VGGAVPRILRAAIAVLAVAASPWWAGPAYGHDSLAPPAASHNWLPDEEWVHRHWIPFDEQALKGELGLRGRELHAYLYDDHRTLAELARRRGLDEEALADRLVAPWQGIAGEHRAVLRERALRILTQGHLAQHMFFHVFHGLHLDHASRHLFGMPGPAYRALRDEGYAYVELAERGGVPAAALRSGIVSMLESDQRDGIARREAWPVQSDHILARRLGWLSCWLRRPAARLDPANPYGKNRILHGPHSARWPGNARERRENEVRVERFRRALPASCWPRPPRWSWAGR